MGIACRHEVREREHSAISQDSFPYRVRGSHPRPIGAPSTGSASALSNRAKQFALDQQRNLNLKLESLRPSKLLV